MITEKQRSWLQIQRTTDPSTGNWSDVPTGRYNLKQGQAAWDHLNRLSSEAVAQTPIYHFQLAHYTVNILTQPDDQVYAHGRYWQDRSPVVTVVTSRDPVTV